MPLSAYTCATCQLQLAALGGLDPKPQNLTRAVAAHAQCQIHRFVAHNVVFPDLHPQCVARAKPEGRLRKQPDTLSPAAWPATP